MSERLRAAGTHGGERLVTRGVDEADPAVDAVDLGVHLVGADVLGDATRLAGDHVGAAEGVEELGLAVVDVTHHRHDRRPDDEVTLVALVGPELEVEGLEQLAVLVLRRDDLDDVVELVSEQLQRRVVDRLGRRHHLAEVEQHLHERCGVDADLVGEVGQGRAAGETHGLAVALADPHAADRRGLHGLELLATRALRLAAATGGPAGTTEGTLGLATLAGTTTTGASTATGTEAAGAATGTATTGRPTGATATGRTGADAAATRSATTGTPRTAGAAAGTAAAGTPTAGAG